MRPYEGYQPVPALSKNMGKTYRLVMGTEIGGGLKRAEVADAFNRRRELRPFRMAGRERLTITKSRLATPPVSMRRFFATIPCFHASPKPDIAKQFSFK
jgi:hypothetical protein